MNRLRWYLLALAGIVLGMTIDTLIFRSHGSFTCYRERWGVVDAMAAGFVIVPGMCGLRNPRGASFVFLAAALVIVFAASAIAVPYAGIGRDCLPAL